MCRDDNGLAGDHRGCVSEASQGPSADFFPLRLLVPALQGMALFRGGCERENPVNQGEGWFERSRVEGRVGKVSQALGRERECVCVCESREEKTGVLGIPSVEVSFFGANLRS
jgi:hypothetical protein